MAAVGAMLFSSGLVVAATAPAAVAEDNIKVWICKYSHTPEFGEEAQTVNSVDYQEDREPGTWGFEDQHSSTYVYGWSEGPDAVAKPDAADDCPPYDPPGDDVVPVPERPATEDPCGTGNITFVLPADTTTLDWERLANGDVTVTPKAGFKFADDPQTRTFELPADSGEPCPTDPTVVTPRVVFVQPTCEVPTAGATAYVGDVVDAIERQLESDNNTDTDDNGVTFTMTSGGIGKGKSVTITATAADGYVFPDGLKTMVFSFDFNDAPTDCGGGGGGPTVVAPSVDFDNPTCADLNGSDVDVVQKTGIVYDLDGTPGLGATVTVTATAQSGFVFAGGVKEQVFSHTFPSLDDLDCVAGTESIRPAVTFTEASCEAPDGAGFAGIFTDVVDYTVDGEVAPGESVVVTATIKAEAADQFAFPAGFDNTFEHTFAAFDEDECVKGTQTSKPKPEGERPPTVLGTSTAVPTAVDAGLTGGPTAGERSASQLLAQLMVGAGLLLLLGAGWTGVGGRRTRGVHEA